MADWGWKSKFRPLWYIAGVRDATSYAKALFPSQRADENGQLEWKKFYEVERHWKSHRPSTPKPKTVSDYFPVICRLAGLEPEAGTRILLDGTVQDLLAAISAENLKKIPERVRDELCRGQEDRGQEDVDIQLTIEQAGLPENTLWQLLYYDPHHRAKRLALNEILGDQGLIEQKFCYLTPEAVHNWRDLVKYEGYQNYVHCQQSLRKFLTHKYWIGRIQKSEFGTVVMLGAGAGDKSNSIIDSISLANSYSSQKKLRFVTVDSSAFMIEDDVAFIADGPNYANSKRWLELKQYKFDFLKWPLLRRILWWSMVKASTGGSPLNCRSIANAMTLSSQMRNAVSGWQSASRAPLRRFRHWM